MDEPVSIELVMIAALFLLGALGEMIFARTQIPDVVWLIAAGVLLRATGLVKPAELADIQPLFGALTLIIVLFDGGSKLVVSQLLKSAPRASLMAILSFGFSVIVVAAISMGAAAAGLLPNWSLSHGIMLGAILGGSSSLIIMPSMQLARVEPRVANLVSIESALTDALCVVVTVAMIGVVVSGETSTTGTMVSLAQSFGIALAIGVAAGWTWMPALRLLSGNPHAYPVTLAALILLYVVVDGAGGSAAMAILAFAVIVGNADALIRRVGFSVGNRPLQLEESVRTVHSQLTFIIKSFFFTFIGLMLAPPWSLILFGVVVGTMLLLARWPAVRLANLGAGMTASENKLIGISLPRGLAAGVLASMPAQAGAPGTDSLPSLVFSAVVTSIVVFAVGFKLVRGQTSAMPAAGAVLVEATGSGVMPGAAVGVVHAEVTDTGSLRATAAAAASSVVSEVLGETHTPIAGLSLTGGQVGTGDASSSMDQGAAADEGSSSGAVAGTGASLGEPSNAVSTKKTSATDVDADDEDVPITVAIREIVRGMPDREDADGSRRVGTRRVLQTNFNVPKQPPALGGEGSKPSTTQPPIDPRPPLRDDQPSE